jgi:Beta-propeller repeat
MKSRKRWAVCVLAWAGSAVFFLAVRGTAARNHPQRRDQETDARSVSAARRNASAIAKARMEGLSMPMAFEPNAGEADGRAQFVGRGKGMSVWLERDQMRVEVGGLSRPSARGAEKSFGVRMRRAGRGKLLSRTAEFAWQGEQKLPGVSNYFVGNDPAKWRTRVPHYARAEAAEALPGVGVEAYGNDEGVEYDLRVAPGTDARSLRLDISGAEKMRLASDGDLVLRGGGNIFRMKKPEIYEEAPGAVSAARESARRRVNGGYVIEADGSVGFRIGRHDAAATLVIDPSLSVAYATFLGGAGGSTAESVAVDPAGNVYVAGTTATPATFPETGGKQLGPGPVNGTSGTVPEFFIAEIKPAGGANQLVYLTFLGGSGIQTGGIIAVDASGDAFLTGTTTSGDYPVTDGSQLTPGPNDVVVSEIAAGGSALTFSTLFGGSESESQFSTGGIALDASGDVYIAGDTNSTDLPVTPATTTGTTGTTGAYQTTFPVGAVSDGYLAIFTPSATPSLKYCTYLGTNSIGDVGVGGIAVDTATPADAYIAGFTENAVSGFPAKGGFQTVYGGGRSNAFLMEIMPAGDGPADLVYGTLLGGSVMDEALGVAVDFATPPNVYLTGVTQSKDFPVKGTTAAYQTSLRASVATNPLASNAFLSVITLIPATGMTKLVYSTYLGGSQTDVGQGVAVESPTVVYVTGTTSSWDFPWKDNLQPFNGTGDAFIVKMNPQVAGTAALLYATPLGGTAPPGESANASGNSIVIGGTGLVYVGGQTTAADFPTAVSTAGTVNGFQAFCASCAASPPAGDAFVAGIAENAAQAEPSVYFNTPKLNFPAAIVGTPANGPQLVAVFNGGEAPLSITSFTIIGANSRDFSLQDVPPGGCAAPVNPGPTPTCTFEVGFTPSVAGPEAAVISFTDNAPGSPQALELVGVGEGLLATPGNLNFGNVPVGNVSPDKTTALTNTSADETQINSIV